MIPRRALPHDLGEVSVLGLTLGESSDGRQVGTWARSVRAASDAGVTLFDLSAVRDPDTGWRILVDTVSRTERPVTVLLPKRSVPPSERMTSEGAQADPPGSGRWRTLPASGLASWLVLELRPQGTVNRPAADATGSVPEVEPLDPASELRIVGTTSDLFAGPVSLLDQRLRPRLEEAHRSHPLGVFARDPFAGGRLDGTRMTGNSLTAGPASAPTSVRTLTDELGPVLRLGFLTQNRRRTLPQAAIRYLTAKPWLSAALVPPPLGDRWTDLVAAFEVPELTEDEVEQIERPLGRMDPPGFK
jgi:hypothetical protein